MSSIKDYVPIYFELKNVLRALFSVNLNLHKTSFLVLQLHTVVDPYSDLASESIYQQLPGLRQVPLATQETVMVWVPIGMKGFVDDAI